MGTWKSIESRTRAVPWELEGTGASEVPSAPGGEPTESLLGGAEPSLLASLRPTSGSRPATSRRPVRPVAPTFVPGEIVAERFEIVALLGQGGMGQVFEARDLELESPVALKVIRPEIAGSARATELFKREVQLARQVTHANVCRIFDLYSHRECSGRWGADGRAILLLSMELLRGESLERRLRRRAQLPAAEALPLIRQIAAGLQAAHDAGITHRDLKPENVFLVEGTGGIRAVITDFGLALAASASACLRDGVGAGTPAYLAPEQLTGEPLTRAVDIYAFGLVLYRMLTGELPFRGDSPLATARLRLSTEPVPPRMHLPAIPVAWECCILRCLERRPERRFARISEVPAALEKKGWESGALRLFSLLLRAGALGTLIFAGSALEERSPPSPDLLPLAEALGGSEAREEDAPGIPSAPRPTLEVEAFGADDAAAPPWVVAVVSEAFTAGLRHGAGLRLVPTLGSQRSTSVAGDVARGGQARSSGADYRLSGELQLVVGAPADTLRLEVLLQQSQPPTEIARFSRRFAVKETAAVIAAVRSELARRMGAVAGISAVPFGTAMGLPRDAAALRDYGAGLLALRDGDPAAAIRHLLDAAVAEPESAAVQAALSEAWEARGYPGAASAAAHRAVRSIGPPESARRRWLEARAAAASGSWEAAAAGYRSLWREWPDEPRYGLALAGAQLHALGASEAEKTLRRLRRGALGPVEAVQADLLSARLDRRSWRWPALIEIAGGAAKAAAGVGRWALAIEANLLLAQGLVQSGRREEAVAAAAEARSWATATGNLHAMALSVLRMPGTFASGKTLDLGLGDLRAVFRRAGDRGGEARAMVLTARQLSRGPRERSRALELALQAKELALEIGNRRAEAEAYNALGVLLDAEGSWEQALASFEAAVAAARESGAIDLIAGYLQNAALELHKLHKLQRAGARFEAAVAAARRSGDRRALFMALIHSGSLHLDLGGLPIARSRFEEARRIARGLSSQIFLAMASERLGEVLVLADEADRGLPLLEDAIELWGNRRAGDRTRLCVARFRAQRGELVEAETMLRKIVDRVPPERFEIHLLAHQGLALTLLDKGEAVAAEALIRPLEKLVADPSPDDLDLRAEVMRTAARIDAAAGRSSRALAGLQDILSEVESKGSLRWQLELRFDLAHVLLAAGQPEGVRAQLEWVRRRAREAGFRRLARRAAALVIPAPGALVEEA